jgi:hypothetical protein
MLFLIVYLYLIAVNLFGTHMTCGHNLFVLGPEFFALLGFSLLAFCLSFELGLFAILGHWS